MRTLLPEPAEAKGKVWIVDWMGYSIDYGANAADVVQSPCRALFGTQAGAEVWAEQVREAGQRMSVFTQPSVLEVPLFE